jgi:hypothetical protein
LYQPNMVENHLASNDITTSNANTGAVKPNMVKNMAAVLKLLR